MRIRIEATELPGRSCGIEGETSVYRNIHVGVQRRERSGELLDLHPGDARSSTWTLECTSTATPAGIDITGRYIQGRPGGRFIYLSWGTVDHAGDFAMFRRAKLMFDGIEPEAIGAAVRSGLLLARLGLTDARGEPLCAAVRPPLIEWRCRPG